MKKFRVIAYAETTEEARKHGCENAYSGITVFVEMPNRATAEVNGWEIKAEAIKAILQEVKIDYDLNVYRVYSENIKIQRIMDEEEYQKEAEGLLKDIGSL